MTATVLSGPERRRRWTTAEKLRIVEESLAAGMSVVEFARQRDLHPNLVHTWRWQARKGMLSQHFRPQYVLRCQHVARCHAERTDDVAVAPTNGARHTWQTIPAREDRRTGPA